MNYVNNEQKTVINNEYDYSNIIAETENIVYIAQYFQNTYSQFLKICEEDEIRNKPLKYEFQNYNFKNYYSRFEINIRMKTYNNVTCNSLESLIDVIKKGQLNNVNSLEILLELDYYRGANSNKNLHENSFKIIFKPYDIIFARKSNYNEENMNQIENNVNGLLKKFKTVNTIFCTKINEV